jgi:hypothetical protein
MDDDYVDTETGEVISQEEFDQLNIDREEKIESVVLWIKNLKAEAKAIKDEEENLAKRRKSLESKADSLTRFISRILMGSKFKTTRASVSYRKSKSVNIIGDVPEEFLRVKTEPNKTAIKEYLATESCDWAEMQENKSVVIK